MSIKKRITTGLVSFYTDVMAKLSLCLDIRAECQEKAELREKLGRGIILLAMQDTFEG